MNALMGHLNNHISGYSYGEMAHLEQNVKKHDVS